MFQEYFVYLAIGLLFLDLLKFFFLNQDEKRPYVFLPFFNILHLKWSFLSERVQRHTRE